MGTKKVVVFRQESCKQNWSAIVLISTKSDVWLLLPVSITRIQSQEVF